MKTVEDFLASLAPEEYALVQHIQETLGEREPKAAILLSGQVVETTAMIACLWQTHHPKKFRVGKTKVGDIEISTVFMTVAFGDCHFETMVFAGEDRVARRYKTLKEAKQGHADVVRQYKARS